MSEQSSEPVFENEVGLDVPAASSPAQPAPAAVEPGTATPASHQLAAEPQIPGTTDDKGAEPSGAEKRIHQLTRQREEERTRREAAEREMEVLRAQLAGRPAASAPTTEPALPAQTAPQPPEAPAEPDLDDYPEDYEGYAKAMKQFKDAERIYIKDLAKYELTLELQQRQQQETERQRTEQAQNHQNQVEETFKSKMAKAFEDDPDFRYSPIFTDTTFPCPPVLFNEIKESESPAALFRYLSDHREEAARLAALQPKGIIRELGRIEAQLNATKPPEQKLVSGAPEPIVPLNNSAGALSGEDSDDIFFAKEAAKFA